MGYTGTVQNVLSFACDNYGNVVMKLLTKTFNDGILVGAVSSFQTFSCGCCQFCCCIDKDAGGTGQCNGVFDDAGLPTGCAGVVGSACGTAGVCGQGTGSAPLTRIKTCNNANADVASCTQNKDCSGTQCQCAGTSPPAGNAGSCGIAPGHTCCIADSVYTGDCLWVAGNDFTCTSPPGGC